MELPSAHKSALASARSMTLFASAKELRTVPVAPKTAIVAGDAFARMTFPFPATTTATGFTEFVPVLPFTTDSTSVT
jgi:hypothetical protein